MKLNLGCGFVKKTGHVNVDISKSCMPDQVVDLCETPWPWADSSCEAIAFEYSLEFMGSSTRDLLNILSEAYRVMKPDGTVHLTHLHPRHDRFAQNPLAVHKMSPGFFRLLSVSNCLQLIANVSRETYVAFDLGINFEMESFKFLLDKEYAAIAEGNDENAKSDIRKRMNFENNICLAYEISLVAKKNKEAGVDDGVASSIELLKPSGPSSIAEA